MRKLSKRMQVKEDLLQQLENTEMNSAVYIDLVDKYMAMWDAIKDLEREWKKGKRMIEWDNGGGQKGVKPNPAGKEYRETIKSMTELLKKMNLQSLNRDDNDEL
ncbi:P27 family phage terminase small subunit [Bacillus mycoides]|uniref:P27 family phage terminase small subunit n=1 Tax=Bacillus mycoides TaxID=1405 RepID=UPI0011A71752|nr:P27 family phage terminase small subunit [Bacillus mycoides]